MTWERHNHCARTFTNAWSPQTIAINNFRFDLTQFASKKNKNKNYFFVRWSQQNNRSHAFFAIINISRYVKNDIVCNRLNHGNWNSLYYFFGLVYIATEYMKRMDRYCEINGKKIPTKSWTVKRELTVNQYNFSSFFRASDNKLNFDWAEKKKDSLITQLRSHLLFASLERFDCKIKRS